eukprot:CAMPEP_0176342886 /NCGR_PEP_ID=MMETSP0126-20121128/3531_1 /TAXON_ID=141414 ORGANISM="Strombidinopsis acuminatum, Strain SPMC142" /NCGR_SAMPLE_ID=MMETSP0126 /ASSEMBLY_ACC=CAM_ASM_000229 /LENGTH=125 /DNA_ID=CAMNT_0017688561 /DNA_START=855 /DNA_END=1232 /DNA_ORIENTATION=-
MITSPFKGNDEVLKKYNPNADFAIEENNSEDFDDDGELVLSGIKARLSMQPLPPTKQNLDNFEKHQKAKTIMFNKKKAKEYAPENVPITNTGPKTTAFSVYSGFSSLSRGSFLAAQKQPFNMLQA